MTRKPQAHATITTSHIYSLKALNKKPLLVLEYINFIRRVKSGMKKQPYQKDLTGTMINEHCHFSLMFFFFFYLYKLSQTKQQKQLF